MGAVTYCQLETPSSIDTHSNISAVGYRTDRVPTNQKKLAGPPPASKSIMATGRTTDSATSDGLPRQDQGVDVPLVWPPSA